MTSASYNDVANTASLVEFAVQGAYGLGWSYKTVGSPNTTLKGTWETLCNIKTYLDAFTRISYERRQAIDAAAAKKKCKSLSDIENEFQKYAPSMHRLTFVLINPLSSLWATQAECCLKYEQSSYYQRHLGSVRTMINNLEADVKALQVDTWVSPIKDIQIKISSYP